MTTPCIEIVVYKVKSADDASAARRAVMPVIESFPGFLSWRALRAADGSAVFADYLEWASEAEARAAADAVSSDQRFARFMATADEVISMNHLTIETTYEASETKDAG